MSRPSSRREIIGLGLENIGTAPATYRLARLALCKMRMKETSPQTEAEKEIIDEPLQSKLASELMKRDENLRKVSGQRARKKAGRYAYLFAAIASSVGITSMAAGAVYYRFVWQVQVIPCLSKEMSICEC